MCRSHVSCSNDSKGNLVVEYRASFAKHSLLSSRKRRAADSDAAAATVAPVQKRLRREATFGSCVGNMGPPLCSAASNYCLQLGGLDSLLNITYNCSDTLSMSSIVGAPPARSFTLAHEKCALLYI